MGIGLGLFLIVHAGRSTRMELRVIGAHLRIVNTFRSVDILIADIEDVIPEPDRPGPLQVRARGLNGRVRIDVSPRNRQERDGLRRSVLDAMRQTRVRCPAISRSGSGVLGPWGAMRATDQAEGGAA